MFFSLVRSALLALVLATWAAPTAAQVLTPTTLVPALSARSAPVGGEVDLLVTATIQPRWHLYATDFNPAVGPTVFTLAVAPDPAFALVGPPRSVGSHHMRDDVFHGEVAFFEQTGRIRQRVRVLRPGPLTIRATAAYQSCSEADGRCVQATSALTFGPLTVVPATVAGGAAPAIAAAALPPAPAVAAAPVVPAGGGLWRFGLLAFLSGLAALLTPCVFPMIPMTVSVFTGGQDSRRRSIFKALVYGGSIIGIYTVVGVAVARLLGAEGPNFLATHWLPNLLFFVVFLAFGLSFLGLFEITLPSGLVNRADRQADKGGWTGIFFMAFTLVLVSFSCTGPIVATVLSLSAQGETLRPVVGMAGFSLAFALPFTLFAIFPSWLKGLPKSGGWLNTVKVTLGFAELLLALKFLSTVDLTYHWHLLPRDLYLVLWIALGVMLALYLLGQLRLAHDGPLPYLSVGRVLGATAVLAFVVYLVPGLFGAPLPLLAGYLPPPSRLDFTLAAPVPGPAAPGEAPRYASFLELPQGLPGYFDLAQARRAARRQHKPLFVDFTGHGCVNCRKMEATVWSDPAVLEQLRRDYVVVALYVDDKTELPRADWYTSKRDGQRKTTLGQQNADAQLTRFGVNAQPYYVLLDPATDQLLAPPVTYEADPTRFAAFLAAGQQRYQPTEAALAGS